MMTTINNETNPKLLLESAYISYSWPNNCLKGSVMESNNLRIYNCSDIIRV